MSAFSDTTASLLRSEATQCVPLYSRQGTTDTIDEVEDEQDQGEGKQRQQVPWESQQLDVRDGPEGGGWSDAEPKGRAEEDEGREGPTGEQVPKDQAGEEAHWESSCPDESPSVPPVEAESPTSAQEKDLTTESEDGGEPRDSAGTEGRAGTAPDTDASKTSDGDVPPSYSKAVSFDRLEISDDESDRDRKRRMVMTSDSRSDSRSDIMLPSMTTELTASELLLNK